MKRNPVSTTKDVVVHKSKDLSAWGVWTYIWDYNSYALPDEGWHPNKEATQIAKDLTKDQAEKLAKKTNIANRPKYEAMLEKERKKFEKLTEKKATDAKVWTEKRKK